MSLNASKLQSETIVGPSKYSFWFFRHSDTVQDKTIKKYK